MKAVPTVTGTVVWALCREAARALVAPLRTLLWLPQRAAAKRASAAALAAPPPSGDAALARFRERWPAVAKERPHVLVSAGETSGELHAVRLMQAVEAAGLRPRWSCFGGRRMAEAGGTCLFPLSDHAIMGIGGAFAALPLLVRALWRFVRMLRDDAPDLVVLVDYPGFHKVMAEAARRFGVPVVHYIAPQYWAWGPWRMQRYRKAVDATLAILPFEPALFMAAGIPCEYVGHPLLDRIAASEGERDRPARALLPADAPVLCLLPGSREREIRTHLPGMVATARALRADVPGLRVVLPHEEERRAASIGALLAAEDASFVEFRQGPIGDSIEAARVVLAKSGTGSLEACLRGTPTVVVYRVPNRFGTLAHRFLLTVPWFASANLIAGRQVVPELCFRTDAGWQAVTRAVQDLWREGPARARCEAGLAEVRRRLGAPGASARAARWILARCAPNRESNGSGAAPSRGASVQRSEA